MYKPGDKLPNEMVLVETLGVSRTTLRDAIAAATHNELIIRLYENISTATVEAFDNESVIQKNDQVLVLSHRMITEMLKRRDAEGAKLAMRLHIKPSIEFYNLDK